MPGPSSTNDITSLTAAGSLGALLTSLIMRFFVLESDSFNAY